MLAFLTLDTKKYNKFDLLFLVLAPLLLATLTVFLPINLLFSTILFFGLPAAYISWQRKDLVSRTLIYSFTIAVISILTDYLAEQDQSWVSTSMFNTRVAGIVPIEALVWMFAFTYLIIAYYLYFFDTKKHNPIGKRLVLVFGTAIAVLVWLFTTIVTGLDFRVEFYYIKFGLAFLLLPLVLFSIFYPRYLKIFAKITPYFFLIGLVNLLISLDQGHWSYPGDNFIGWVNLFSYSFPIEELVFWIILFPSFLISQFELFNNDNFNFRPWWKENSKTKKH
jgi:hypothetical protein